MSKKNTREASTTTQKSIFLFLLFVFPFWLMGQEKLIQGLIIIDLDDASPEGIVITNFRTKNITIPDSIGNFNINVKVGDLIHFTSDFYESEEFKITEEVFEKGNFEIQIQQKIVQLEQANLGFKLTGDLERDVKNATRKDSTSIIYDNLRIQAKDIPPPNPNGRSATEGIFAERLIGAITGYNKRQKRKFEYAKKQEKLNKSTLR